MTKAIYDLEKLVCVKTHDEKEEHPNRAELIFEGGEILCKDFDEYYKALDFERKVTGHFKNVLEIDGLKIKRLNDRSY